jgi:uncharacterized glyoxalase superfamily protein PhnB
MIGCTPFDYSDRNPGMVIDFLKQVFGATELRRYVYVRDVDATYRRALAAGGVSVQEPEQKQGDPDRRGGVKDPAGNTWWVTTQIEGD